MALMWSTRRAIPRLRTYADAKRWHDDVVPIRGNKNDIRPVGKRSQAWFSIWLDGSNNVHVGYGTTADKSERQSLVCYSPSGTITVSKRTRWGSASNNERCEELLGSCFRTYQYDTWVHCAWYDEGEKRKGWLPLRCNGATRWDAGAQESVFIRDAEGDLVFLNYRYPVVHKIDKAKLKEVMQPYQPFLSLIRGLEKLNEHGQLVFSEETYAAVFGRYECPDYHGNMKSHPNDPPNINYGNKVSKTREEFLANARSGDHETRMIAAMTLAKGIRYSDCAGGAALVFRHYLLSHDPHSLLTPEVHKEGTLVKNRFKRYVREGV